VLRAAAAVVAALLTAGCGFIASGDRPAGKPNGFVLRGYVSVGGVPAGSPGAVCAAPPSITDIAAGGPVRVADPQGHTLGAGKLAGGVLAVESGEPRCTFAFEITGVAGGVDQYVIGVGTRPTVTFPARDLRENKPAVIKIDS
jgi:hypothetical protein